MRRFRNVSRKKQAQLAGSFPGLLKVLHCDGSDYKENAISVFDHCLNEDEAREQIDNVSKSQATKNDALLHKFIVSLSRATEVYLVKEKGIYSNRKVSFKEFTSDEALVTTLTPKPWHWCDKDRFVLVFPALGIVYFEHWDFTHLVYFNNESGLELLSKIAAENGVYLLK